MTRTQRLARRLGLDHNPLRRRTDRIAACLGAGLLTAFLIGAPLLSMAAAGWAGRVGAVEQRAQRTWHEVSAVLLRGAPVPAMFAGGLDSGTWVPAKWKAPDGRVRTGQIDVTGGMAAGQEVAIWVDPTGVPTGPPLTGRAVVARTVLAAAGAPIALGIVLAFLAGVGRWVFDQRRLAGWDAGWASVGPHWTKRFWSKG
jgi:hypothetical protein